MTSEIRPNMEATGGPEQISRQASRRRFLRLAALATAGAAVGTGGRPAHATPPSGLGARTDLAVGRLEDGVTMASHGASDFHIVHAVVLPGADSGWHTHPGTQLDIVTKGTVTVYLDGADCDPVTVEAGNAVFVPAGVAHRARNEGSEPAEGYLTYLVAAGAAARNEADEPDNCQN